MTHYESLGQHSFEWKGKMTAKNNKIRNERSKDEREKQGGDK
jgi:hypothetical protein